jgi:hypothetical protein
MASLEVTDKVALLKRIRAIKKLMKNNEMLGMTIEVMSKTLFKKLLIQENSVSVSALNLITRTFLFQTEMIFKKSY